MELLNLHHVATTWQPCETPSTHMNQWLQQDMGRVQGPHLGSWIPHWCPGPEASVKYQLTAFQHFWLAEVRNPSWSKTYEGHWEKNITLFYLTPSTKFGLFFVCLVFLLFVFFCMFVYYSCLIKLIWQMPIRVSIFIVFVCLNKTVVQKAVMPDILEAAMKLKERLWSCFSALVDRHQPVL